MYSVQSVQSVQSTVQSCNLFLSFEDFFEICVVREANDELIFSMYLVHMEKRTSLHGRGPG